MQLGPEVLDAAVRALKMFSIGAAIIAMIPLAFALMLVLIGGRGSESVPFTMASITLTLLVIWTNHCGQRLLKSLRQGSLAAATTK